MLFRESNLDKYPVDYAENIRLLWQRHSKLSMRKNKRECVCAVCCDLRKSITQDDDSTIYDAFGNLVSGTTLKQYLYLQGPLKTKKIHHYLKAYLDAKYPSGDAE